jgi:hypothetical protein
MVAGDGDTHQTKFGILRSLARGILVERREVSFVLRVRGGNDICRCSGSTCLRTWMGYVNCGRYALTFIYTAIWIRINNVLTGVTTTLKSAVGDIKGIEELVKWGT